MILGVVWSPRALEDLEGILDYLLKEWGAGSVVKFLERLEGAIETIKTHPQLYQASVSRPGLRRCVLNSRVVLYYQVKSLAIQIISVHQTKKLK
jgi:plasmid stabilization system protein ParE